MGTCVTLYKYSSNVSYFSRSTLGLILTSTTKLKNWPFSWNSTTYSTVVIIQKPQVALNRTDRQVFFAHTTIESKETTTNWDVKVTNRKLDALSYAVSIYDSITSFSRTVRGCESGLSSRKRFWTHYHYNRVDYPDFFVHFQTKDCPLCKIIPPPFFFLVM